MIADCVNPWPLTRDAWWNVARRAGVGSLDVELICSDTAEHRRRIEERVPDIPGHQMPAWQEVIDRDYHPWGDGLRLIVDTAAVNVEQAVRHIIERMGRSPAASARADEACDRT